MIGWCRRRRCWYSSLSSRPICSRSSTRTDPVAVPMTRSVMCTSLVNTGHTEVVDADLSAFFDTIPHAELMRSVARRISDRHLLALLKQWLVVPVEETDNRGHRRSSTSEAKDTRRGVPQGAPISPLLSSVYMRRFLLGWKTLGHEQRLEARIVNFADDFVICCRETGAECVFRGIVTARFGAT